MLNKSKMLFVISLLCSFSSQELIFDSSTIINPFDKTKMGIDRINEDRAVATHKILMVADGIGGSSFPSGPFAVMVLRQMLSEYYNKLDKDYTKNEMKMTLVAAVKNYNSMLQQVSAINENNSVKLNQDTYSASTTLVGLGMKRDANNPNEFKYEAFQLGDSLQVIYRLKKEIGTVYYQPVYTAKEMTYEFNHPKQLSTLMQDEYTYQTEPGKFHVDYGQRDFIRGQMKANEGDLALLGSDGLFDNISFPVLAILINFATKLCSYHDIKKKAVKFSLAQKIAKDFVVFINKDNLVHNYFEHKKKKKVLVKRRKSLTNTAPTQSSFICLPNFLCGNKNMNNTIKPKKKLEKSEIPVSSNQQIPNNKVSTYPFKDMNEYMIDSDSVIQYVQDYEQNSILKSTNLKADTDNLFELFGCNISDYFELNNGALSDCIKEAIKSFKINQDTASYLNPNIHSTIVANFIKELTLLSKDYGVLTPFALGWAEHKNNVGNNLTLVNYRVGLGIKRDDVAVVIGHVIDSPKVITDMTEMIFQMSTNITFELTRIMKVLNQLKKQREAAKKKKVLI